MPRHTTVSGPLVAFRFLLSGQCLSACLLIAGDVAMGGDPLEDQGGSVSEFAELLPDVLGEPSSLSARETLKERTAIGQDTRYKI